MKIKTPRSRQFREVQDPMAPRMFGAPEFERWEYRSLLLARKADLNPYAQEGWELVSAVGQTAEQVMFYFRRRLTEAKP